MSSYKNTRRAAHEALDLILDGLEADARGAEDAAPVKKYRRTPRQVPPIRPLSDFTPEQIARASKRM